MSTNEQTVLVVPQQSDKCKKEKRCWTVRKTIAFIAIALLSVAAISGYFSISTKSSIILSGKVKSVTYETLLSLEENPMNGTVGTNETGTGGTGSSSQTNSSGGGFEAAYHDTAGTSNASSGSTDMIPKTETNHSETLNSLQMSTAGSSSGGHDTNTISTPPDTNAKTSGTSNASAGSADMMPKAEKNSSETLNSLQMSTAGSTSEGHDTSTISTSDTNATTSGTNGTTDATIPQITNATSAGSESAVHISINDTSSNALDSTIPSTNTAGSAGQYPPSTFINNTTEVTEPNTDGTTSGSSNKTFPGLNDSKLSNDLGAPGSGNVDNPTGAVNTAIGGPGNVGAASTSGSQSSEQRNTGLLTSSLTSGSGSSTQIGNNPGTSESSVAGADHTSQALINNKAADEPGIVQSNDTEESNNTSQNSSTIVQSDSHDGDTFAGGDHKDQGIFSQATDDATSTKQESKHIRATVRYEDDNDNNNDDNQDNPQEIIRQGTVSVKGAEVTFTVDVKTKPKHHHHKEHNDVNTSLLFGSCKDCYNMAVDSFTNNDIKNILACVITTSDHFNENAPMKFNEDLVEQIMDMMNGQMTESKLLDFSDHFGRCYDIYKAKVDAWNQLFEIGTCFAGCGDVFDGALWPNAANNVTFAFSWPTTVALIYENSSEPTIPNCAVCDYLLETCSHDSQCQNVQNCMMKYAAPLFDVVNNGTFGQESANIKVAASECIKMSNTNPQYLAIMSCYLRTGCPLDKIGDDGAIIIKTTTPASMIITATHDEDPNTVITWEISRGDGLNPGTSTITSQDTSLEHIKWGILGFRGINPSSYFPMEVLIEDMENTFTAVFNYDNYGGDLTQLSISASSSNDTFTPTTSITYQESEIVFKKIHLD